MVNSNLKEVIKLSLTLDSSGYGNVALPNGWTYQNCHVISERILIAGVSPSVYSHYISTLTTPNYCGIYSDGILHYSNVNAPSAVVDIWLQKD